jgi:multiple sugar transport system ATP-binding protein
VSRADVVESVGSDKYVHFSLEAERASSPELEELAADAGTTDLSTSGVELVSRLPADSRAAEGEPVRLWFDIERVHLFDPGTGRNLTLDRA